MTQNKIPISKVIDEIISGEQTFHISLSDYIKLSPETRTLVRGQRRVLTQLLHLRLLIKNIQKIDFMNKKYMAFFINNEKWNKMSQEEKKLARKTAEDLYNNDRKNAYGKLADFMAEHGDA